MTSSLTSKLRVSQPIMPARTDPALLQLRHEPRDRLEVGILMQHDQLHSHRGRRYHKVGHGEPAVSAAHGKLPPYRGGEVPRPIRDGYRDKGARKSLLRFA